MRRTALLAALITVSAGAHASMDCEAMFEKAEAMVASSSAMTASERAKAYRMAIAAHEMCMDGKEEMAEKLYFETEAYIKAENDRS